MSLIDFFRKKKSADKAKGRLKIIIAQQRTARNTPDFLPLLRQDIITAITKYVPIDLQSVNVDLQCRNNHSVLELNVLLPDRLVSSATDPNPDHSAQ